MSFSSEEDRIESIKDRWNKSTKSSVFDELFGGTGYCTVGYYETESDSLAQSVRNMTALVAEISEMKSASHVLDLGCGQGIPVMDIAVHIGCSVVGVDLAECHIENANTSAEFYKKEKKPDLESEFYAASYFDLPEAVTNQTFTHVLMQTSMFYAHHRIDEILSTISKLLRPGGVLVTTDVLRTGESADLNKFMKMNFMSALLTLDEMKAALLRNGLKYYGGENLDDHFIKSAAKKTEKIVTENIPCPSLPFFKLQEAIVKNKEMTFQIVMAKKI